MSSSDSTNVYLFVVIVAEMSEVEDEEEEEEAEEEESQDSQEETDNTEQKSIDFNVFYSNILKLIIDSQLKIRKLIPKKTSKILMKKRGRSY